MKKIYLLAIALLSVVFINAQDLVIDETFDNWDPTGVDGYIGGDNYSSWAYTTPNGSVFELQNCRYKNIGDAYVDLERDDRDPIGAIILPEIPSCSKIEIDYRSGNNSSVTGERAIYISTYDGTNFTKISDDYPAIGANVFKDPEAPEFIAEDAKFQSIVIDDVVVSETPIRFAIQGWGSGNLRIENIRVWTAGEDTGVNIQSVEYSPVVSTEYYNLSGVYEGTDFNALASGLYIKVSVLENGSKTSEKVLKK